VAAAPPAPEPDAFLLAAGDIAQCNSTNDEATADLLASRPGTIALLGDNAYESGSFAEYTDCFGPSWGQYLARTAPSVGNHEYKTPDAAGYWDYWGAAAGTRGEGYYSYDLGAWHIVVLNSNCSFVSCDAGSAQEQWLRADLAASDRVCTLAYWHHPRFSSGPHGNTVAVQPLWQALYDYNAEVVLVAHDHIYERFAPQTPTGVSDPARGIRQFVVGTGGRDLYTISTIKPNSQVRRTDTFGVLALVLADGSYRWQFVPVAGKTFTDTGSTSCH
jgi:acid phosphatase type 7